jgi:Meiotically up-regulated gene 113
MTRRLEPQDRVKELGDASVPFPFDVHAMVFSENAPSLEAELHRKFDERRLNLINRRKEFFRVEVGELASAVKDLGEEIVFTMRAEAAEFSRTQKLREESTAKRDDIEDLTVV